MFSTECPKHQDFYFNIVSASNDENRFKIYCCKCIKDDESLKKSDIFQLERFL